MLFLAAAMVRDRRRFFSAMDPRIMPQYRRRNGNLKPFEHQANQAEYHRHQHVKQTVACAVGTENGERQHGGNKIFYI